jgi:hypothetical protein
MKTRLAENQNCHQTQCYISHVTKEPKELKTRKYLSRVRDNTFCRVRYSLSKILARAPIIPPVHKIGSIGVKFTQLRQSPEHPTCYQDSIMMNSNCKSQEQIVTKIEPPCGGKIFSWMAFTWKGLAGSQHSIALGVVAGHNVTYAS